MLARYRATLLVIPLTLAVTIAAHPQVAWDYVRALLIVTAAMLAVTILRRAFSWLPSDDPRRTHQRRAGSRWLAASYALFCMAAIYRLVYYLGSPAQIESLVIGGAAILTGVVAQFLEVGSREGRRA